MNSLRHYANKQAIGLKTKLTFLTTKYRSKCSAIQKFVGRYKGIFNDKMSLKVIQNAVSSDKIPSKLHFEGLLTIFCRKKHLHFIKKALLKTE